MPLPFLPNVQTDDADAISLTYTILLDDGSTIESSFEDLAKPGKPSSSPNSATVTSSLEGIPTCLHPNSKVTMDHEGVFHKGYIHLLPEGGFQFVVRRNARSTKIDWSVPLPNFKQSWTTLMGDDILFPGHKTVSSFLRSNTLNNAPSANFVSAKNLLAPCPPSLVKAIHPSNPDRQVWLDSYAEEKQGLIDHDVYDTISKKQYLALRRSGKIPKAIPSMCVLIVKTNKDGKPDRAKSRIVVLGNFEDRIYQRSQRYAPVLKYDSLRLLTAKAVSDKRILQQGDCKNVFCNAVLPEDETTVIRPPIDDPAFHNDEYWLLNKTLYGLRRSPHHWYNMVTGILQDMGLSASLHDPCLYTGVLIDPDASPTPTSLPGTSQTSPPPPVLTPTPPVAPPGLPPTSPPRATINVGLYVDDFVFYSTDQAEEDLFQKLFQNRLTVDFMGDVDYFLGTAFTWVQDDNGHLSVHLCQSAFTEFIGQRFGVDKLNRTPNLTPYRSGLHIDAIPNSDPNDPDLKRRTKVFQSIAGCINWLACCTRPDVSPVLAFLASYNMAPHHAPHHQLYKAAIHVLKYLLSTAEYGISFHSDATDSLQAFNHFSHHHDKEAYSDATPPSPSECHQLTVYSDACWGGQFSNHVPEGTPLELFKFRSLSGVLICRSGGPISWKALRQDHTALSSCEAEIIATNECVKDVDSVKLRAVDLGMLDGASTTTIYNDNAACVQWSASCTTKGVKHLNLRENMIREHHKSGACDIKHIPGQINPSDIFTKEIKDAAHFRRLRDCMMVSKSAFLKYHQAVPSHIISAERIIPYYSIRSSQDASNHAASA